MTARKYKMAYPRELIEFLTRKAWQLRKHVIRMTCEAGSGHPGGSLSAADIIAVLYFHVLRLNPQNPNWEDRDRFILSKGHACPIVYAALAERGFFPVEELMTLRKVGSRLQGHPDMRKTPGIDMTSGSLGQGLSVGVGMALGARLMRKSFRVFVMLGDGEIQEGQVWEAAMAAGHHRLGNLKAILDYNKLQVDGFIKEIVDIEPVVDKWLAFNWAVREIDGHNIEEIIAAFDWANSIRDKPCIIIAHTIKGKGVSFMENVVEWHGKAPNPRQRDLALKEIEEREAYELARIQAVP